MGYVMYGLLAADPAAAQAAAVTLSAAIVDLGQGLKFLPYLAGDPDQLVGRVDPMWLYLTERVVEAVLEASDLGPTAYVEAEFFGGAGQQSAVAWHKGQTVMGPLAQELDHSAPVTLDSPINTVLRHLGVRRNGDHDEFDTVRLGRHRNVEDWLPQ